MIVPAITGCVKTKTTGWHVHCWYPLPNTVNGRLVAGTLPCHETEPELCRPNYGRSDRSKKLLMCRRYVKSKKIINCDDEIAHVTQPQSTRLNRNIIIVYWIYIQLMK